MASTTLRRREARVTAVAQRSAQSNGCADIAASVAELIRADPHYSDTDPRGLAADVATLERHLSELKRANHDVDELDLIAHDACEKVAAFRARLAGEPRPRETYEASEDAAWQAAVAAEEHRNTLPREGVTDAFGERLLVTLPKSSPKLLLRAEVHLEAGVDEYISSPHPALQQRVDAIRMLLVANAVLHRANQRNGVLAAMAKKASDAVALLEAEFPES